RDGASQFRPIRPFLFSPLLSDLSSFRTTQNDGLRFRLSAYAWAPHTPKYLCHKLLNNQLRANRSKRSNYTLHMRTVSFAFKIHVLLLVLFANLSFGGMNGRQELVTQLAGHTACKRVYCYRKR